MGRPLRIVAILAAFNEEDVIGEVLTHLAENGVDTYLIDHGSTDGTRQVAASFLGRGVFAIEDFGGEEEVFPWSDILSRKEALTKEIQADWFIHQDADEFRDAPWRGVSLADAIAAVDRAGYNAIDFGLYDFWPTERDRADSTSVQERLLHHTPGAHFNQTQIRCWKRTDAAVDLVSSGGHQAAFAGRRVFPLRFVLRHYPIRSEGHGRRKVWEERLPRFRDEERSRGWHIQYDGYAAGQPLQRRADDLTAYESSATLMELAIADLARLEASRNQELDACRMREAQALEQLAESERARQVVQVRADAQAGQLEQSQAALAQAERERQRLDAQLAALSRTHAEHLDEAARERADLTASQVRLDQQLAVMTGERDRLWGDLQAVYTSRTWRFTRPARWLAALLEGLRP